MILNLTQLKTTHSDILIEAKMSLKVADGQKLCQTARVCVCLSLCLHILNMSVLIFFFF